MDSSSIGLDLYSQTLLSFFSLSLYHMSYEQGDHGQVGFGLLVVDIMTKVPSQYRFLIL